MDGFGSQEYRAPSIGADGELDLGLDLELDLGLVDDDEPQPLRSAREFSFGIDDFLDDPLESPTRKTIANSSRQVAGRDGQAARADSERALSEVPSVELGRDAAPERSLSLGLELNGFDAGNGNDTTFGEDPSRAQDPSFDVGLDFGQDDGQRSKESVLRTCMCHADARSPQHRAPDRP